MKGRVLACGALVLTLAVPTSLAAATSGGSDSTNRDRALVRALVYHRSDIPAGSVWLVPRRQDSSPCVRRDIGGGGIRIKARDQAGWVEAGNTLIRRVMWSVAEASDRPDVLYHARIAEAMMCIDGKRAARQPGRLVDAPPGVKITSFYGIEANPSGDIGFELMVVRVGNAVAQYIYRWVKPPYRESGLALVRKAVARGVAVR